MNRTPSFIVQYFGDYILLDRIAVGGMAEIFRAKQSGARGFEKIVVIKKILQHLGDDPEFVSMFEDEAKIAAQLNQANIVQIYELGEVNENLYIVMEYVEGKNLRDVIRALSTKNLQLSIPQSLFIISEILKGLDYAHRKTDSQGKALEIVHRDMSPQNVIVSYEGEVKILDFGIAKASSKLSKTEVGVLKGKFSYMSPEQASGRLISQSTDLYAVGVMFHEMLTGQRLFRAETDMETLERVRQAIVPKPSETNPSIPEELDQIVLKALHRNESKRFVNAGEFLGALTEFSFNHKMSYNSQGLSSFLKTLFASNIEKERQALQRSLREKPLEDQSVAKNIKTHIAFKSPQLHPSSSQNSQEDDEITVFTKSDRPRSHRFFRFSIYIFLGVSILAYFWSLQSNKENAQSSASQIEKEEITTTPVIENQTPPENSAQDLQKDSKKELETKATKDQSPGSASAPKTTSRVAVPEAKRKGSALGEIFGNLTPPAIENPTVRVEPRGAVKAWTFIDLVAPLEGYAVVYINDTRWGEIPSPNARNIRLEAGRHRIRCETQDQIYESEITLNRDTRTSIRCQELESRAR